MFREQSLFNEVSIYNFRDQRFNYFTRKKSNGKIYCASVRNQNPALRTAKKQQQTNNTTRHCWEELQLLQKGSPSYSTTMPKC